MNKREFFINYCRFRPTDTPTTNEWITVWEEGGQNYGGDLIFSNAIPSYVKSVKFRVEYKLLEECTVKEDNLDCVFSIPSNITSGTYYVDGDSSKSRFLIYYEGPRHNAGIYNIKSDRAYFQCFYNEMEVYKIEVMYVDYVTNMITAFEGSEVRYNRQDSITYEGDNFIDCTGGGQLGIVTQYLDFNEPVADGTYDVYIITDEGTFADLNKSVSSTNVSLSTWSKTITICDTSRSPRTTIKINNKQLVFGGAGAKFTGTYLDENGETQTYSNSYYVRKTIKKVILVPVS